MSPVTTARLSGLVVFAIGFIAAVLARRLPVQTGFGLGPAFLPFWTGLVLATCGLWLCVRAAAETETTWPGRRGLVRAGVGFIGLLLYALALEPLGYFPSTATFLVLSMFLLDPHRPTRALFFGFAGAVLLLFTFRIWLRVPLPGGFAGW